MKKISIEKKFDLCNECPYFNEHEDISVCYDSFDDPNYDWYCKHPNADNSGTKQEKWNDVHGKFIGGTFSRFQRDCKIPDWCPLPAVNS